MHNILTIHLMHPRTEFMFKKIIHLKNRVNLHLLALMLVMIICPVAQSEERMISEDNVSIEYDETVARVKVVEAYVEWRSGPAEGFPVLL